MKKFLLSLFGFEFCITCKKIKRKHIHIEKEFYELLKNYKLNNKDISALTLAQIKIMLKLVDAESIYLD